MDASRSYFSWYAVPHATYRSIPGKRPLPGKRPVPHFMGPL